MKKLQEARVQLQKMNLKKSGENKFANFRYYELADFLPACQEICLAKNLFPIFSVTDNLATLEITDLSDTKSTIIFTAPFAVPSLKGGNEVQNLGAGITYLRRYLYMMAFEIIEADVSDAVLNPQEHTETSQNEAKTEKPAMTIADKAKAKEMCIFGKNNGVRWADMRPAQLAWYRDNFLKKEKLSFTDALALQTIQELLGTNINQPVVEEDLPL